jgi:hypothetical protein
LKRKNWNDLLSGDTNTNEQKTKITQTPKYVMIKEIKKTANKKTAKARK